MAAATNLRDIVASLDVAEPTEVTVIDSIQTMYLDTLDSGTRYGRPGADLCGRTHPSAKRRGFTVILVGHVTKEGQIAGPRVLEHMVDTVLYFEGERGHQFRILRSVKNRYGPANEIGVFEMTDGGLMEVPNPSALFLAERRGNISGATVFAGIEGTRPVLVEIQAWSRPPLATPRRAVVGWDSNRFAMILAVLEARCGLGPRRQRGLSQYRRWPPGDRTRRGSCLRAGPGFGAFRSTGARRCGGLRRVGLSGEVRMVGQAEPRFKEAAVGFPPRISRGALSRNGKNRTAPAVEGLETLEIAHLQDLIDWLYNEVRASSVGTRANQ